MPNDGGPPQRRTFRTRLARLIAGKAEIHLPPTGVAPTTQAAIRLRLKEFETSSVRDVMTSRAEISAVNIDASLGEVLVQFAAEAHSRMPVYGESLDEPMGFIHIKDL
ncbi:MAG: CBS domain-containing protein, partial [Hyphomonadaceae bacterium]